MNDETKLLALLDSVYAGSDRLKSKYKKIRQSFNEETGRHEVTLLYEFTTAKDTPVRRSRVQQRNLHTSELELLRQIQDDVRKKKRELVKKH